jgi:hypothetical protein
MMALRRVIVATFPAGLVSGMYTSGVCLCWLANFLLIYPRCRVHLVDLDVVHHEYPKDFCSKC